MNSLLLASLILAAYLCAAGTTIFAQSTDAESRYAAVFAGGSTEEKRNALYEIRNARSPELSRVAIAALNDSDDIVRATAAFSIIYLPVEDAERALLANLSDRAEIVRRETALALARIRAPRAALPVIAQIG